MDILASYRKSERLAQVSRELGGASRDGGDPVGSFFERLHSGPSPDESLAELWEVSRSHPANRMILDQNNVDLDEFKRFYRLLVANGAGQWARGHFVAASALAFAATLDFVVRELLQSPAFAVARLTEYFERNETGPL